PGMIFDPNDPRLTAYVLGELDQAERENVETMLAECPECRQAIDEIRLTTGWLAQQLHDEQSALADSLPLNANPAAAIASFSKVERPAWWRRNGRILGSLAALFLLCATGLVSVSLVPQQMKQPEQRVAVIRAIGTSDRPPVAEKSGVVPVASNFAFADGS